MIHVNCEWVLLFQWAAAFSGFAAALFWLLASLVKVPALTYATTDDLVEALRSQSRMNAFAAAFTAVAVVLQAIIIVMPTCINLS